MSDDYPDADDRAFLRDIGACYIVLLAVILLLAWRAAA